MGIWNSGANFAIAVAKALLVAVFFMHLARGRPVYRLVAVAALYTLALLMTLSLADYSARERYPAPWQAPAALR
jgi:cytochrome c oxidase subunit 4